MDRDPLDKFGSFLMRKFRDRAIDNYDRLAQGKYKSPKLQTLQQDLAEMTEDQRRLVRACVIDALDVGLHDFLFALQERADFENDIQVIVDGKNVAEVSDGLQGELFSEEGWFARFSAYGEPVAWRRDNRSLALGHRPAGPT